MKSQVVLSTGGMFETIFYCRFTRYPLSIIHSPLDDNFLSSTNDTDFAWFSKFIGGNAGLKVIFHIKNEHGIIFNTYLKPLEMNTELVYADGYATTFMPLSTLKEKNTHEQAKNLPSGWQVLHY